MTERDTREKSDTHVEADPAARRDPRSGAFESMPVPRSDVWPAPSRPSIDPPSRPSTTPRSTPGAGVPASMLASGTGLARPTEGLALERATWAIAALSQAERDGASDESVVRAFVDALGVIAPEALVLVRLIDPDAGSPGASALGYVFANGKLLPDRRERLELSEASAAAFGVSDAAAEAGQVELVTPARANFSIGGAAAFPLLDVPLLDAGALIGIVSIEEPSAGVAREAGTLIAALASLLGASLRNARLERAAVFFRDYLAQTLEHASAPIFVLDRSRVVRSANSAALALVDLARTDTLGRDFASMLPETDRARAMTALAQAFSGRAASALELGVLRKDLGTASVAWNVAPIYDADGDASAVVVIGQDLTEVHRLEGQILHTDKLATLGQLAAGIVHELNNPLTSITVYGEYLHAKAQRAGGEAGDVEKLRRIVESANRMTRFTRDLVTYARPSNEDETALSIREVALEGARFCEHLLSESHVVLATDFDTDLAPISGVRGQLHQVFVNLVTNASHALAGRGGGTVRLEAHKTLGRRGEDEIVVRVSDDGPGISLEHLPRIFDSFFTTKSEGRGTGLGLSIVRKIVKAHRGSIEVSTRHEEGASGTTFELRFPAI